MTWMTGWSYRKSHVINAAAGAGTLYQKMITVHYEYGIDSGGDVYLGLDCILKISIPTIDHTNYGLSYPVTYCINIPAASANLTAWHKHAIGDAWSQLTAKTTADFFNGIEYVRWDYANNKAYVGVSFDSATDDIYIEVRDAISVKVVITFNSIPQYYDNRKCAVILTADDWYGDATVLAAHQTAGSNCTSRHIVLSHGIITYYNSVAPDWDAIQDELDGGYAEVVNHSKYHVDNPTESDADIITSLAEIKANLDLPTIYKKGATEYIVGWLEPFGTSSATQRTKLGQNKYLCDRDASILDYDWGTWDAVKGLYNSIGGSVWMGSDGSENLAYLKAVFDTAYAADDIFFLMFHPTAVNWGVGQYAQNLLDYIKDKLDVWYVGYGAAYTYHYVQERATYSTSIVTSSPKCRTDFGDIRFTDDDGTTLLDCWMESKTDSNNAIFWVEVKDSLSTDPATIYVYYGKADATYPYLGDDNDQGEATFLFFDHFLGSAIDTDKWAGNTADATVASSIMTQSKIGGSYIYAKTTYGPAVRYRAYGQYTSLGGEFRLGFDSGDNVNDVSIQYHISFSKFRRVTIKAGSATSVEMATTRDNNYHILQVFFISTSSCKFQIDNVAVEENTTNIPIVAVPPASVASSGNNTIKLDWVFVSKYVSPEPAHSTWGSEEHAAVAHSITITEIIGCYDTKSRTKSYFRTVTEPLGVLDTKSRIKSYYRTIIELLGASDTESRTKSYFRTITEMLGGLDTKSRTKSYYRTIIEILGGLDTRSRTKIINRTVTELLGELDVKLRNKTIYRTITESLGALDSKNRIKSYFRTVTELLGGLDTKTRIKSYYRTIIEIIGLKDSKLFTFLHNIIPTITAGIGKVFKEIEVLTRIKIPISFSKKYNMLTFLSDFSSIQLQEILGVKSDYKKAVMLNLFQIDMPVSYNKIDEIIFKLTSSIIHQKNEKILKILINLVTLKEIMEFLNEE